ncbi:hypothetical protein MGG_11146 [Pyricularia oryzae 70-15]|uniref:Uncharacterized protein n=1 Tax=Pyricularia oryzae (strain 70-15 / ATCC MYA-4617 / FGSC 8958) TaxID=242507 RepID=G4MVD2_PYRO7|nr:uncharacterized protein MGG_11146 [Pyricularia oryzae 70-15]EHA54954.1 hypothetical protein MGG_11146 [Pyricularia oryzae 70-15]
MHDCMNSGCGPFGTDYTRASVFEHSQTRRRNSGAVDWHLFANELLRLTNGASLLSFTDFLLSGFFLFLFFFPLRPIHLTHTHSLKRGRYPGVLFWQRNRSFVTSFFPSSIVFSFFTWRRREHSCC